MVEGGPGVNSTATRAAATVASVYGFFLLFAQFAFVELIRAAGHGVASEKLLLGLMALAGVTGGFLAAWRGIRPRMIRASLGMAALAAVAATFGGAFPALLAVSLTTGATLGAATVALAALLPGWCGILAVATGTGLGYAFCNLPWIFPQPPTHQAWIAAAVAALGALAVPATGSWRPVAGQRPLAFPLAVILFTALVWMDSAAFFIIQHVEEMKSGTWGGAWLWRNSALHIGFAVLAGVWLSRGAARAIPVVAWVMLAVAALWVNDATTRTAAGWLYPSAVSLYSVALVVWPGWFSGAADSRSAAWRAAWLFAVAGWFGSANGIGMAETLRHVPPAFIVASAFVVLVTQVLGDLRRLRPALAVAVVVAAGWIIAKPDHPPTRSAAGRGRMVYLAEGCIHCHSQYIRPGSHDEPLWGSAPPKENALEQRPVLIGNRRQGPDLSHIGARRSEAWLKAHFMDPRLLSPGSVMPSYAHLFKDGRGDDLVQYLRECGVAAMPELMNLQAQWKPSTGAASPDANRLYARHCAVCHGEDGQGDGPLASRIPMPPTNLRSGPFIRTDRGDVETISRVIKFGVIGSQMPGHETLKDGDILSLAELMQRLRGTM
jgi:cytochrome c oxidase cbb3-type subunit 2